MALSNGAFFFFLISVQTYAIFVFDQTLIVTTNRNQEQKDIDIFEAVDPLLSLGSLATNIEHSVGQLAQVEVSLGNTVSP